MSSREDLGAKTRDEVRMRLPAQAAYVAVLRTTAAGLAARLDFTIDEIEDLRIAVDEACALLLPRAVAGADLLAAFTVEGSALQVTVSVASAPAVVPRRDTFAWTVLTALADDVTATVAAGDAVTLSLRKRRSRA